MDTNLKTSKKIRFFFYHMILVASFVSTLFSAYLGRESLYAWKTEGTGITTGKLYYLPEFREYISKLYSYGMVSYAGAGDDLGYPLSKNDSRIATVAANTAFLNDIKQCGDDLMYHIKKDSVLLFRSDYNAPLYSQQDGHLILPEDVILCCYWDGPNNRLQFFSEDAYQNNLTPEQYFSYQYKANSEVTPHINYVIALKNVDEYTSPYFKQLDQKARQHRFNIISFLLSASLFVLFGIINLFTAKSAKCVLQDFCKSLCRIPLECKLLLLLLLYFVWKINYLWLYGLIGILIYLFIKDIQYNGKQLISHSLVFSFCNSVKQHFQNTGWQRKISLLHIIYLMSGILCLLAGIVFLTLKTGNMLFVVSILLILFGLLMLILSKRFKNFICDLFVLSDKMSTISTGEPGAELTLSKNSPLKTMATDLTNVEKGIEAAVENNLRANRMRVELITNVSHDLKTPLTSIINYSDLLCEEHLPAPANEYALALRTKAYRLKGMVQDVFELSKATSGNLPMEKTRLDLTKLIHQTLADMDEQIQESTLIFKTNIPATPLMIEADGEKLYRVFQNLIVNALQYSLENSRVYIEAKEQEENAYVWIKSISRQELDFDPKEIVERFVRADASRTTEGSGLGLSIVQSFTEACGGTFSIDLNADLFTAFVSFPLSLEPLEEEKNEEDI